MNDMKDDIHAARIPIKTGTFRPKVGMKWLDKEGKVIREFPPDPPCKKYLVFGPDQVFTNGVDIEELLKECLEYEHPAENKCDG